MKKTLIALLMVSLLLIGNNSFAIGANSDFEERGAISIDISAYEPAIKEYVVGVKNRILSPFKNIVELVSGNMSYSTYPAIPYGPKGTGEDW